ncbi:MAG: hypothetical protein IPO87_11915 [Flavobacteriales bacterium]|nr:hypothetical protein [Flavobacteriales bacterium]
MEERCGILSSSSGQTRSLINARGGSNNNFGNNAACPTAYLRLINGGQALAGIPATDNTISDWAPEQSFTGLTGDPNGTINCVFVMHSVLMLEHCSSFD